MNPKISVIIPIYNVEKYLRQCVDSVLNQTYKDLEVILVDDGSPDNCPRICDEYAAKDSRVRVIHKENGGVSSAREKGLSDATGEYVMFVDADDWIDLDTVSACVEHIAENENLGCVIFSYCKHNSGSVRRVHIYDGDVKFSNKSDFRRGAYRRIFGLLNGELNHPERLDNLTPMCMKLYRADLVRRGKFMDIRETGTCEDGVFNIGALLDCESGIYIDKPMYHYRKVNTSATNSYKPELVSQWKNLFSIMGKHISDHNLGELFSETLNNRVAISVIEIGVNELRNPDKSFFKFNGFMRSYIKLPWYKESFKTLRFSELPLAWKIILFCSKHNLAFCLCLILYLIKALK